MSQWVSEWVSEWVCHTKRVERSTDRNLPPIFTKLATKVESQEMWLPIVFGGNPKYFDPPNHCSYGKISLMLNISKTVSDTMLDSKEVRQETTNGLSIGVMTFDLGWPWTLLVQGRWNYTSNILKTVTYTTMGSMESSRKPPMGYRLAPWPLTLNDLEPF